MAVEYLFGIVVCLLPVAAFSGWYLGRRDGLARGKRGANSRLLPDYSRGLNYLLEDRPDKAVEVFIELVEVESDTVETHLALGNLFRRRGEVDRAIRIHQNLVARTTLEFDQRTTALLELGLDYMRSGLLDRAESLFKELLDTGAHQRQAVDNLVNIYQQEQDWDKALEYTGRFEKLANRSQDGRRAHFLCEQAAVLISEGDVETASDRLRKAERTDPKCVRASLMQADLAMTAGAYDAAIRHLRKIETQDIAFIAETLEPLIESYQALGREQELIAHLERLCELHVGITPVLALSEVMQNHGWTIPAKTRLLEELERHPTIHGIARLVDYSLLDASPDITKHLTLIKAFMTQMIKEKPSYSCGECGFHGRTLHWQCPGCKTWNSVKPVHGEVGE